MKLTTKLSMKIEHEKNDQRNIEVEGGSGAWIEIGAGRNTQSPRVAIHREDVSALVAMLNKVTGAKLPEL